MNAQASAWLAANRGKFKPQHLAIIQERLKTMDDEKVLALSAVELKDPTLLLIVEIFLGELGIHRFLLGEIGMGILFLLTGGLCGLLWFIDLFTVTGKTKEFNYQAVLPFL